LESSRFLADRLSSTNFKIRVEESECAKPVFG
jgi:hypothetical protein